MKTRPVYVVLAQLVERIILLEVRKICITGSNFPLIYRRQEEETNMCGIYLITNVKTHKVYVGQSVDIQRRWVEHQSRAFNPNNNCYHKPLYASIRKHGLEAFEISILCECSQEELNDKEREYIKKFNSVVPNGYNILDENNTIYNVVKHFCICCGAKITVDSASKMCRKCYTASTRTVERPTKEELYSILRENKGNFTKVGKIFGVSDNAIRKWCKGYDLPSHSSDYKID